jgi:DNA-binding HxlR family transcriptional regulator
MATRTAAQRRDEEKLAYNAFLDGCPTRQLLNTLSDKWVCLVLAALGDGPLRYSELSRRIAGVSQKMLTQTLRTLLRDGIVTRTVTPTVPVRVDYELTDLGRDLAPVLTAIKTWAEANMDRIDRARSAFDTAVADTAVADTAVADTAVADTAVAEDTEPVSVGRQ